MAACSGFGASTSKCSRLLLADSGDGQVQRSNPRRLLPVIALIGVHRLTGCLQPVSEVVEERLHQISHQYGFCLSRRCLIRMLGRSVVSQRVEGGHGSG